MFLINFFLHVFTLFGIQFFMQGSKPVQHEQAPIIRAHLFIHGTYLPGLILLDPQATFKHKIGSHSPYVQALKYARLKEVFSQSQVLLGEGLQEITSKTIELWHQKKLPANLKRKAAIHVISAYDQFVDKNGSINKYFTYGWLGVLDDDCRLAEAKKLYISLDQLHGALRAQYPKSAVEFILHGHSHGGNVILYLAHYEHEYKKCLPISFVGLYAAPVQSETVNFCKDPLFKNIFLLYSYGDIVQNNDHFSTKTKKCYRKFTDLISLKDAPNNIYQICVCAHDKSTAFGHQSMFCLDSYYQLTRVHRYSKPYRKAVSTLNPLPLIAFSPIIMDLLSHVSKDTSVSETTLSVIREAKTCFFAISSNHAYAQSQDILPRLIDIKKNIKSNW